MFRNSVFFRLPKKYKRILSKHQIRQLPVLIVLMVISGMFEMMSVSLMLPFMNLVVDREDSESKLAVFACNYLGISSERVLLVVFPIGMAMLYVIKGVYLIWETKYQQSFVSNTRFETQKALLSTIIYRPYEFFMDQNTSRIQAIISYVKTAYDLLVLLLNMMGEMVTSGMLIITIFVITPKISLLISIGLFFLLLVITRIIKPSIERASEKMRIANIGIGKWTIQAIQGIKEVKIEKKEEYFITRYDTHGREAVEAECSFYVFNSMPRLLIESVTMSAFFSTVAIHIMNGKDLSMMIPVISVIAMAALRLLPAANRISNVINNIAFSEPYLDELLLYLSEDEKKPDYGINEMYKGTCIVFNKEIRMSHISYHYPNNKEYVLSDASLVINKGEAIGIVGTSGAGKTTLVDVILGLLNYQSGMVTVDGIDIRENPDGWMSQVGYIPQNIFMLDDTIKMNIAFGVNLSDIDDERVWKVLDEAAIGNFVRSLPDGIDTQIGEHGMRLSGGQRQRVGIARALYREPQILVFDEATSALDNETEKEIMEAINGLMGSKTMIIIAHRLTTIERCDHVYRVENGKVIKER